MHQPRLQFSTLQLRRVTQTIARDLLWLEDVAFKVVLPSLCSFWPYTYFSLKAIPGLDPLLWGQIPSDLDNSERNARLWGSCVVKADEIYISDSVVWTAIGYHSPPLKWGDTTVLQAVTVKNSDVLTVDDYILGLFTIGGKLFGMTKYNEKL